MNISYTKKGDYLLPNLILKDKKQYNIGKYGLLRLEYIKKQRLGLYFDLLVNDTLNEYLHEIDIVSLCKKNGYCWPTNRYFMKKFECTKPTVSKSISSLSKFGYIDIEINNSKTNNSKRIIKLSEVLKKKIMSIRGNNNTSIQNNFNHDNKRKKDILDDIYYIDENGTEYWHGVPIESKETTLEEQEEMEQLLESFKEKEEEIK